MKVQFVARFFMEILATHHSSLPYRVSTRQPKIIAHISLFAEKIDEWFILEMQTALIANFHQRADNF